MPSQEKTRIQKYLSAAGVASRRAVEEMVLEGRIDVNGQLVDKLPCFVDPQADEIRIDGRRIRKRHSRKVYYLLNKPRNVVCTASDPQGRRRAVDLLGPIGDGQRVYCVGRLDADSTGLILLTNDGELTQHLTHPSHGVSKTYTVAVDGRVEPDELDKIKRGVYLGKRRTRAAQVKVLRRSPERTLLEITLREGRNREIRLILLRLGHKVRRLKRVAIGPITDFGLKIGHARALSAKEVTSLRKSGESTKGGVPKKAPRKANKQAQKKSPSTPH